jgi:hypothetical protein
MICASGLSEKSRKPGCASTGIGGSDLVIPSELMIPQHEIDPANEAVDRSGEFTSRSHS